MIRHVLGERLQVRVQDRVHLPRSLLFELRVKGLRVGVTDNGDEAYDFEDLGQALSSSGTSLARSPPSATYRLGLSIEGPSIGRRLAT
jgi:hypothetical protein